MAPKARQASLQRLLSRDVFRGLTVAAMVPVNNPGSWGHIYAPLKHAARHGCTPTDLIVPISKALWTRSFVLYTAGWPLAGWALCYWFIDVKGYRAGTGPFIVFGRNAMGAFIWSGLLPKVLNLLQVNGPQGSPMGLLAYFHQTFLVPFFSPRHASLPGAVLLLPVCFAPIGWM